MSIFFLFEVTHQLQIILGMVKYIIWEYISLNSSDQVALVSYSDCDNPILSVCCDHSVDSVSPWRWWPVCVSVSVWAVSMAEMEHKLSVFQEVDEDIHRSIQVGQEAGEGAGTF